MGSITPLTISSALVGSTSVKNCSPSASSASATCSRSPWQHLAIGTLRGVANLSALGASWPPSLVDLLVPHALPPLYCNNKATATEPLLQQQLQHTATTVTDTATIATQTLPQQQLYNTLPQQYCHISNRYCHNSNTDTATTAELYNTLPQQ